MHDQTDSSALLAQPPVAFSGATADGAEAGHTSLRITKGLHAGAVHKFSGESVRLGADAHADIVIIDLPCESITFYKDALGQWCVQCSGEEIQVAGYQLPEYENLALAEDCEIVCGEFAMQFTVGANVRSSPTVSTVSDSSEASMRVPSKNQQGNFGGQKNWGLFIGGLGAAALVSSVLLGIQNDSPPSTASPVSIRPAAPLLDDGAATPPHKRDRDREREQIADFVNALRMPVFVQSISETAVDLVWTAMDSPSGKAQSTVGKTLFGRQVRWVQASAPMVDNDEQNVRGRGSQKKQSDRGNPKTEETLRSLGLAEIAQIQATGSRGRYLLTRSGHRIFEGSDLRSGAQLTLIGTEAMTVVSNGTTLLVPYDVAKSVNKLANVLTASKQTLNEVLPVSANVADKLDNKCIKSMTYVSGTGFAKCEQEGDKVSTESRSANELLRANRALSLKRN